MLERTASVTFLRVLDDALRTTSTDVVRVLSEVGLAASMLSDPDARVPLHLARRAWTVGGAHSGDPDFGLNAAQRLGGATFELIEYLGRTSNTVEEALESVARFARLVSDASSISLERRDGEAHFCHREPGAPRHFAELFFATIVLRVRELADIGETLLRVRFQHAAPESLEGHARIFGAPVHFGQTEGALVFDAAVLQRRLRTADPSLRAILTQHASNILARNPAPEDIIGRVEHAVENAVSRRAPIEVDRIARELALGRRTLQRRLEVGGTSFQEIVDRVRRRIALELIGNQRLPAAEVSWMVGFADVTAFHRAFKRWTGTTPVAYVARRPNSAS
jgi:AraC-like DNA-binding protein